MAAPHRPSFFSKTDDAALLYTHDEVVARLGGGAVGCSRFPLGERLEGRNHLSGCSGHEGDQRF